ncbi:MAG TPA: glycosyltransferase family 39 protein [Candidatus Saccharimonadales bacterium]|nr:glycosyltransferase family 39 protein [Candidatus Saccharimonadales bacterium]
MKKLFKKEHFLLLLCVVVFIFVRSVYFTQHLNFSDDQGIQATDILQDYRMHKIPLIGNRASSPNYQGHFIYQGPAYYYMYFPFLLLTNFEPISSSYLFMLFCAVMVIPLYYGVKLLLDKKSAILMVIIYSLLPYYVAYTRFHWNPNYQLSLLPILLLLMGLYKKHAYKSQKLFILIAIFLGILFQFHYQFIFVIGGIAFYYFVIKRISPLLLIHFFVGLAIGFSPLILFELKHDFYHIRTFLLFYQHRTELNSAGNIYTPHYYLSISFMLLVVLLGVIKNKLSKGKNFIVLSGVLAVVLFSWTAINNFHKPQQSYWSPAPFWSYPDEFKAYQIIQSQHLKDYNVANLAYYNTEAYVIKYLLKRDNVTINYDDYYHNTYLFVVKKSNSNVYDTMSYEVAFFKPSKILKKWPLNDHYTIYLLEREKTQQ